MKKILTLLLTVLMLVTSGVSVFADEPDTKGTVLTYELPQSYEWTVPINVSLSNEDMTSDKVSITKNVIESNKMLFIKILGDENNEFKIKDKNLKKLAYKVLLSEEGEALVKDDVVISKSAGYIGEQDIYYSLIDTPLFSGKYEGTCSFEAKIGDLLPGVYDENDSLLCSWEDLDVDIEYDYESDSSCGEESLYYKLTNNYPNATKLVIPEGVTRIGTSLPMLNGLLSCQCIYSFWKTTYI